jgi:hypothetical protein
VSTSGDTITLYHGTDVDSALDILNNGLDAERLATLQGERPVPLGRGWYTTLDVEVAWFFASLAPGNSGRGYTVIEMELLKDDLDKLIEQGLAIRSEILNVPFVAEQFWFDTRAFDFLNTHAIFRPYKR